jgi:hypothetical protein
MYCYSLWYGLKRLTIYIGPKKAQKCTKNAFQENIFFPQKSGKNRQKLGDREGLFTQNDFRVVQNPPLSKTRVNPNCGHFLYDMA